MEVYLKLNENLYYKITTGKCISINTISKSIKNTKCLPSGQIRNVTVITKEIFDNAKKQLGL